MYEITYETTGRLPGEYRRVRKDDVSMSFAAFVFAHAECGDDISETRLDDRSIACRCLWCGEAAVFEVPSERACERSKRRFRRKG